MSNPKSTTLQTNFYLEKLVLDASFVEILESEVDKLVAKTNGVIIAENISHLVFIIIDLIQNHSTIIIKQDFVGSVIKGLLLFLIRRYNVNVSDEQLAVFNHLIDDALNLLFKIPFKKGCCCK
jgi:hypothetical protein